MREPPDAVFFNTWLICLDDREPTPVNIAKSPLLVADVVY